MLKKVPTDEEKRQYVDILETTPRQRAVIFFRIVLEPSCTNPRRLSSSFIRQLLKCLSRQVATFFEKSPIGFHNRNVGVVNRYEETASVRSAAEHAGK
jgi:hypothetical protein